VRIRTFDIKAVTMPEEVSERVLEWWGAEWKRRIAAKEAEAERDAITAVGEAEAAVVSGVESVKAAARAKAIEQFTSIVRQGGRRPSDEVIIRFFDVIEKLSRRVVSDEVTALRYIKALEKLSESEGSRFIIAPPGSDLLINTDE
jgi:regulator of protease activity HflC (stomatin/prohibitin superfamily)